MEARPVSALLHALPPEIFAHLLTFLPHAELVRLLSALTPPGKGFPYSLFSEASQFAGPRLSVTELAHAITLRALVRRECGRRVLHLRGAPGLSALQLRHHLSHRPCFPRSSTFLLFAAHSSRMVLEALEVLGPVVGAFFTLMLLLFHGLPLMLMLGLCVLEDSGDLGLHVLSAPYRAWRQAGCLPLEDFVQHLQLLPPVRYPAPCTRRHPLPPAAASRSIALPPWSAHLYQVTRSLPALRTLHLQGLTLSGFLRLGPLPRLRELCLEDCELDVQTLHTLSQAFVGVEGLLFRGCTLYQLGTPTPPPPDRAFRAPGRRDTEGKGGRGEVARAPALFPRLQRLEVQRCYRHFAHSLMALLTYQRRVAIQWGEAASPVPEPVHMARARVAPDARERALPPS